MLELKPEVARSVRCAKSIERNASVSPERTWCKIAKLIKVTGGSPERSQPRNTHGFIQDNLELLPVSQCTDKIVVQN